jgi:hypothetical protein
MAPQRRKHYKITKRRLLLIFVGLALAAMVATTGNLPAVWAGITPTPTPLTETPEIPTPTRTPKPSKPKETPPPPTATPTPVPILPEAGGAAGWPIALSALGGTTMLVGWLLHNLRGGRRKTVR